MDRGIHETVQPALVRADNSSRVAQSCAEAANAIAYAGDYAGGAWEDAERQRAMRQQALAALDAIAALAQSAAEAAAEAASDVPESLAVPRRMMSVDAGAAKRAADKCVACRAQCADAWGV